MSSLSEFQRQDQGSAPAWRSGHQVFWDIGRPASKYNTDGLEFSDIRSFFDAFVDIQDHVGPETRF